MLSNKGFLFARGEEAVDISHQLNALADELVRKWVHVFTGYNQLKFSHGLDDVLLPPPSQKISLVLRYWP